MDKKIEAAIRETLVIGNPVSIKRCVDKLKMIFEQEQALRQANVKCQLPHPVQFGRWLLKYCEPTWDEGFLTWSYEGKLIDTKELYDVFEAQCGNCT